MSKILETTKVMFNDGVNFGTVPNMVVAGNAFNKGIIGDYNTVKARYGSSTPPVGVVVIHADKLYRLDSASAFASAPPNTGWTEISASAGGGGLSSVSASPPLSGSGTSSSPLAIDMTSLANSLAGTGLTAASGKLNVAAASAPTELTL